MVMKPEPIFEAVDYVEKNNRGRKAQDNTNVPPR